MTLTEIVFWSVAALMTALAVIVIGRPLPAGTRPVLAALVPVVALGLYVWLGRPDLTQWRTTAPLPLPVAEAVDRLEADTRAHPDDAQAWALLGTVYGRIGRTAEALAAARRAAALMPGEPMARGLLGRSLVEDAGGRVTPEALALFQQDAGVPAADYYLALARSQAADWKGAQALWQKVAAATPEGSALHQATEAQLATARMALGEDTR